MTQQVGYLAAAPGVVLPWLRDSLGDGSAARAVAWRTLGDAVTELAPSRAVTRRAVIPAGTWTLLLTNGPHGTDVGMLPSLAARDLGCCGLRAACVNDDEDAYPVRLLELFGSDGVGPLLARRSIAAANDGGTWVFETSGAPLPFEDVTRYKRRRKSERFTHELLYSYLRELDVPIDAEPEWHAAHVVESRG